MQSILDAINEWIKEILIGAINGNLSSMFGDVNEKVGTIAAEVGRTLRFIILLLARWTCPNNRPTCPTQELSAG